MAMNTTMMADSGGRSSGGLSDMDVNAESFYVGYKLLEQLNSSLDSFKSSVMAVDESLVSSVGCSFSSAKSKATKMRADLDILYRNMVKFKETLERIDSSNAALFASLDSQMSGGFGEEMSETDYALMLEELKKIYNEAKSKNQSELTDYEKQVIAAYEPYAKLEEYNSGLAKLDEIEESLKEKRSELNICTMMASHGAGSKSNSEKMAALSKEINELSDQKKALKSSNKELRAYLLDNGLVEPTGLESIKAAGATLFESGKEAVSAIFSGDKDALNKVKDFAVELKATGAVVQNSITSGVLKLGEYIIDGAEIIVTTGNSIFTGAFDLLKKAYCKVTGAEYTSTTKAMWADTMADVEIDRVGELNKMFYTQTELGKYINEKSALKYDSTGAKLVQNVTTKAAEIVGATVATVATGGAAAPFVAAAIGFTEGVGKTGEEQFAAGNKDAKGVLLSYLGGVGKAAEWYGYGQMGSNVVSAVNKLRTAGASAAANTASKEVLNKTINENLFKKAIGKTFTTADVYLDTAAAGANAVSTKITTGKWNAGEMALDFGLAVGGNVVGDIIGGLAEKNIAKRALENIKSQEKDALLKNFRNIILTGDASDSQVEDLMYNTFKTALDNDNAEAYEILKKFNELKKNNLDLKLVFDNTSNRCYWDSVTSSIVIGKSHVDIGDSGTFCHELGHCLYDGVLGGQLPNNWNSISARARVISSNGTSMKSMGNTLRQVQNSTWSDARKIYDGIVQSQYGITLKDLEGQWTNFFNGLSKNDVINTLKQCGLDDEVINQIFRDGLNPRDLATNYIGDVFIFPIYDEINRTQFGKYCAISDIIASVYEGQNVDLNGKEIFTTYAHDLNYYRRMPINASFHEIIANFTQLKITGDANSLKQLKKIFGEEFYNMLEDTFAEFMKNQ